MTYMHVYITQRAQQRNRPLVVDSRSANSTSAPPTTATHTHNVAAAVADGSDSATGVEEDVSFRETPQHTATHCNSLQHTATHCNTEEGACNGEDGGVSDEHRVALPLGLLARASGVLDVEEKAKETEDDTFEDVHAREIHAHTHTSDMQILPPSLHKCSMPPHNPPRSPVSAPFTTRVENAGREQGPGGEQEGRGQNRQMDIMDKVCRCPCLCRCRCVCACLLVAKKNHMYMYPHAPIHTHTHTHAYADAHDGCNSCRVTSSAQQLNKHIYTLTHTCIVLTCN